MELSIKLSDEDLNYIIKGVAEWLAPHVGRKPNFRQIEPKALGAYEAARYLGVSRPRFYELLQVEAGLAEAAITIGTKRFWPTAFLDDWMAKQQGKKIEPRRSLPADDRPSCPRNAKRWPGISQPTGSRSMHAEARG